MKANTRDPGERLAMVERRLAGERSHLAELDADLAVRKAAQRARIREDAMGGADYLPARREDDHAAIRMAELEIRRLRNALEILDELHGELAGAAQPVGRP